MENAITIRPIGLHKYKLPNEIKEVNQQFYGPVDNKEIMRLNARTKEYVYKVRKAMGTDK